MNFGDSEHCTGRLKSPKFPFLVIACVQRTSDEYFVVSLEALKVRNRVEFPPFLECPVGEKREQLRVAVFIENLLLSPLVCFGSQIEQVDIHRATLLCKSVLCLLQDALTSTPSHSTVQS